MYKIIGAVGVVIIIVGVGVYLYTQREPAPQETSQAATTTPQVAGQDVTVGTGTPAMPESLVSVLYVGMLQDGTVFDSSAKNNNQPLTFVLGDPNIIPGFQIGINGMKEGGQRRISVPPELGYGGQEKTDSTGKVVIPANSTLVFDIQLVKVVAASTTPVQ